MMLPPLPNPPDPRVQRFTSDGKPTTEQVTYEAALMRFLKAVKGAIEGQS